MNNKLPLLEELLKYHEQKNLILSMPGNKCGIGFLRDDIGREFLNKMGYDNYHLPFDENQQVIHTSTHYEKCYPQFCEYFKNHKHDVVFASYDKEGVAVINAAQDNHIAIPDDMEVISMMDTSYALMSRPTLTSVHLPIYDMGALAVRLLTKILNDEDIDTKEVCVNTLIMKRDSTKQ